MIVTSPEERQSDQPILVSICEAATKHIGTRPAIQETPLRIHTLRGDAWRFQWRRAAQTSVSQSDLGLGPTGRQCDQPTWVPISLNICEAELEEVIGHERE